VGIYLKNGSWFQVRGCSSGGIWPTALKSILRIQTLFAQTSFPDLRFGLQVFLMCIPLGIGQPGGFLEQNPPFRRRYFCIRVFTAMCSTGMDY